MNKIILLNLNNGDKKEFKNQNVKNKQQLFKLISNTFEIDPKEIETIRNDNDQEVLEKDIEKTELFLISFSIFKNKIRK
jgi:hypothetical protein